MIHGIHYNNGRAEGNRAEAASGRERLLRLERRIERGLYLVREGEGGEIKEVLTKVIITLRFFS